MQEKCLKSDKLNTTRTIAEVVAQRLTQTEMVYLKGLLIVKVSLAVTLIAILAVNVSGGHSKIAYKKPIYGSKTNIIKDKMKQPKSPKTEVVERPPAAEIPSIAISSIKQKVEDAALQDLTATTSPINNRNPVVKTDQEDDCKTIETLAVTQSVDEELSTTTTIESTSVANKRPTLCTCGIFMATQIRRNTNESPLGKPVIVNELDRAYPCNAVGQKQCQTKCLESIVQHLPNSANILCATLDRNVRKERAYLFIKNCGSQWINTNLAAGREYCCKDGQPYQCPLV